METGYRCRNKGISSLILLVTFLMLMPNAGLASDPQYPDDAQFYFDEAYTQQGLQLDTFPAYVNAYLVLNYPTASGGVGGWEGRLLVDGPGTLLSTDLAGAAINIMTTPQFMVGISDAPLPGGDRVLLATFLIVVTEDLPVQLTLVPVDFPSIPDELAYLNADGMDEIIPMNLMGPPTAIVNCVASCISLFDDYTVPEVGVGQEETLYVTYVNDAWETCGPLNLDVNFEDDCPYFYFPEGSGPQVNPYRIVRIPVNYAPLTTGYHECVVNIGDGCEPAIVKGICRDPIVGDDHLGVFFDVHATSYEDNAEPGSVITAYVVLLHPSSNQDVTSWEACVNLVGDAEISSVFFPGDGVNELTAPCFKVNYDAGIIYRDDIIVLAVMDILVHSDDEEVAILLTSIPDATIPYQLSYSVEISSEPVALPLTPYLDSPVVAWINPQPIGVTARTPSARANGSQITLSWAVPSGDYDGCQVFRRLAGGSTESLNARLLPVNGESFTYIDDVADFAPGSTLFYSYSLVKDEVEIAHSPEVEVQVKNLPVAVTRLLSSVPNPFNPKTEIRFELSTDGPAKVTIHDVGGRLVRTLVDESLTAGPYSRTWFGMDDSGRRAPSGAYYIRLETAGRLDHGKVMLLK